MKTSPHMTGQLSAANSPSHGADALAPICDLNEQFLQMLVGTARTQQSSAEPIVCKISSLIESLDATTLAAAARFPFLLVDFGFRDQEWWNAILTENDGALSDVAWLSPFPRDTATTLARAIIMLAWHTVRTDTETTVVLLGITPEVAQVLKALRLQDIDRIADRHFRRIRPRWEDRPSVWRQLLICAKSTEVETAHDFVLHALQLTAGAALPKVEGAGPCEPRPRGVRQRHPGPFPALPKRL